MKHLLPLIVIILIMVVCAAGCSSTSSLRSQGPGITGDHSARFTDVFQEGAFSETPTVSVRHVFTLRNESGAPATIVSHRTTINTVWHFEDSGDGTLPRTIAAGETITVAMRGRLYQPEPRRFFTELTFETGETMTLEMHVEN